MVRDTHLTAVVVYSGRQDLPSNARAFSLTSFETQSSSCDYMRVSGRLSNSPILDFPLSGNAMVSCNVLSYWAQLSLPADSLSIRPS